MPRRRQPTFSSRPSYGRSSMWLEPGMRRRRGPRRLVAPLIALVALLTCAAAVVHVVFDPFARDDRREVAQEFAAAWAGGDKGAMHALIDAETARAYPPRRFEATYAAVEEAATVTGVGAGEAREPGDGGVRVPVAVETRLFGTLRGTLVVPMVETEEGEARVRWRPYLRMPGLRPGERVRRRTVARPRRARVLGADGRRLSGGATAAIVGRRPSGSDPGSGLERRFDARLRGRAGARLLYGDRVVARVRVVPAHNVRATIRPGLQRASLAALGERLGGVAVMRPRDGSVLALAGLAVSAPQPPGSTFKIVTLAAALQTGVATPSSTYPVRTSATLSGVRVRNANDEACGGTLAASFAESCNSVFAPLGARIGATRLVRFAEAFGFNERPRVPSARTSRIGPASRLRDSLAVGAAAIGQDRDLATPLGMAEAGATIANRGVHARARIVRSDPVVRRRAVRPQVARQVRTMMVGVVTGGTGTAARVGGVEVAGKTGTAELRPTADATPDPRNTDAWFVAFAPASRPRVAVAVMLVGAGAGGAAAAPIARRVLEAALR